MSDDRPEIFLFGATGTIGQALVRNLSPAAAAGVIGLRLGVRSAGRAPSSQPDNVQIVQANLNWPVVDLAAALRGTDTLFLLTGYTEEMISQSACAIDAAHRAGVTHVVHLGAHAAADTPVLHLQWHLDVEKKLEQSGLGWTNLRPNWLMQNVLRSVSRSGDGLTIECAIPVGKAISWVDADDVAFFAAAILQRPLQHNQQTYMLAAERKSYSDIALLAEAMLQMPCRAVETPWDSLVTRMLSHREPGYARSALHYMECVRGEGAPECADVQELDVMLGRQPRDWRAFIAGHRHVFERPS